ncbi:Uncharacterised protein [Chryseobacterium nakagawai]|nr:Uncharacterised protein [Chryseobacterium nakagawai]
MLIIYCMILKSFSNNKAIADYIISFAVIIQCMSETLVPVRDTLSNWNTMTNLFEILFHRVLNLNYSQKSYLDLSMNFFLLKAPQQ